MTEQDEVTRDGAEDAAGEDRMGRSDGAAVSDDAAGDGSGGGEVSAAATPAPAPSPTAAAAAADIDRAFSDLRVQGLCLAPDDEAVLGALLRDAASSAAAAAVTGAEVAAFDPAAWLRSFLRTGVVRVPLGESARGSRAGVAPALDLPRGTDAWPGSDTRSVELHHRTVELMDADRTLDYATALARVHAGR